MIITTEVGVAVRMIAQEAAEKFGFTAVVVIAWDGVDAVVTGSHAPSALVVANLCANVANQLNEGTATIRHAHDEKPRGSS